MNSLNVYHETVSHCRSYKLGRASLGKKIAPGAQISGRIVKFIKSHFFFSQIETGKREQREMYIEIIYFFHVGL